MPKKCSLYADEKIWEIADSLAENRGMSRSELFQHLVIYAGIVGGDYPLTKQILNAPKEQKEALLNETLSRAKENKPVKNQKFWQAVRDHAKQADAHTAETVAKSLLERMAS